MKMVCKHCGNAYEKINMQFKGFCSNKCETNYNYQHGFKDFECPYCDFKDDVDTVEKHMWDNKHGKRRIVFVKIMDFIGLATICFVFALIAGPFGVAIILEGFNETRKEKMSEKNV